MCARQIYFARVLTRQLKKLELNEARVMENHEFAAFLPARVLLELSFLVSRARRALPGGYTYELEKLKSIVCIRNSTFHR